MGFKLDVSDVGKKSQHLSPTAFSFKSSSPSQVPSEGIRGPFVLVLALCMDANHRLRRRYIGWFAKVETCFCFRKWGISCGGIWE